MSNGTEKLTPFERASRLFIKIMMMVMDTTRKAEEVADWLQVVVANAEFSTLLNQPRSASVNTWPEGGWAAEWTRFYKEVFGLDVDLTQAKILFTDGSGWVIMIPQGLNLNQVWTKCGELFPTESYIGDDLSDVASDRTANDFTYAVAFRNRVEADVENRDKSANVLKRENAQSITLLERLLLELWYFWKTGGGHLDLLNVTLCAGSRDDDGSVLAVDWSDNRLYVNYGGPGYALEYWRSRSAV